MDFYKQALKNFRDDIEKEIVYMKKLNAKRELTEFGQGGLMSYENMLGFIESAEKWARENSDRSGTRTKGDL